MGREGHSYRRTSTLLASASGLFWPRQRLMLRPGLAGATNTPGRDPHDRNQGTVKVNTTLEPVIDFGIPPA